MELLKTVDQNIGGAVNWARRELTTPGVIYNVLGFQMGVRAYFSSEYREGMVAELEEVAAANGSLDITEWRALNVLPKTARQQAQQRIITAMSYHAVDCKIGHGIKFRQEGI